MAKKSTMTPIRLIGVGLLAGAGVIGYMLYKMASEEDLDVSLTGLSEARLRKIRLMSALQRREMTKRSRIERIGPSGMTDSKNAKWRRFIMKNHPASAQILRGV